MTKPTWDFSRPMITDGERASVSSHHPTPEILHKACVVLDAFYALTSQYEIEFEEDSEQGGVAINLKNGFIVVTYMERNQDEAILTDNACGLVGYLNKRRGKRGRG